MVEQEHIKSLVDGVVLNIYILCRALVSDSRKRDPLSISVSEISDHIELSFGYLLWNEVILKVPLWWENKGIYPEAIRANGVPSPIPDGLSMSLLRNLSITQVGSSRE